MIKSGEYEKKFDEMEREVDNDKPDPTRSGRAGSVAKSSSSYRGRESTDGDLPLVWIRNFG